jgi:hypothetical protein
LAGQLYDYVVNKLTNWEKERGQNPASPDRGSYGESRLTLSFARIEHASNAAGLALLCTLF